jgi:F420-dependent oxidoreductase-like protein
VQLVRAALRRETLVYQGEHYRIPYDGPGASGLGKPLKLMLRPLRADIPIYLAAMAPKNVALAAEIADGWLPIFIDPDRFDAAFGPSLAGARDSFEIAATVNVLVGDDVPALRDSLKPHLALYVGGMGARGRNFYNSLVRRYGWEDAAERIQELYLGGQQREAIAAVPDELVDAVSLIGPKERIREPATRALRSAKPSGVLPYQAYHVFHPSACGSVAPRILGPAEPTINGTRRAGAGRTRASSTRW